jgi:HSP20 family protein
MERFLSTLRHLVQPEYQNPHWRPSVDIYRTEGAWVLKFDLAGVKQENLRVAVQGRRVIVSGDRRDWSIAEGCRAYQMEISYSQFERSVELPDDLDAASCQHEYRDGMLLVTVRTPAVPGG